MGSGTDLVYGGRGVDNLDCAGAYGTVRNVDPTISPTCTGVDLDLEAGRAEILSGQDSQLTSVVDLIDGIENVRGTFYADELLGNEQADRFIR